MNYSRREFLDITAGVVLSTGISLWSVESDTKHILDSGRFEHGVASGDPLQEQLIIWTRVTPKGAPQSIRIRYEVALDPEFKKYCDSGYIEALKIRDYTVKIDLKGLSPYTRYYYRFKTADSTSTVGTGRTLPREIDKVTLAVFSCANYTSGYFNVYQDAAQFDQIDAIIHLGDYIYEYGMYDTEGCPAYGTRNAKSIGRILPKGNDTVLESLSDYRKRYALYRSDPDLQLLHARVPFIVIWDDHEIADNAYRSGAKEHNDSKAYLKQKKAAIQAYYEWLPIRPPYGEESDVIYRAFHFGTLLSLYMLDTRLVGRDMQLQYEDYINIEGVFDLKRFEVDRNDSERQLLGSKQMSWLDRELSAHQPRWQFLAQQVKMSHSDIPLEAVQLITRFEHASREEKTVLKHALVKVFNETGKIKARMALNDKSLTPHDIKRLKTMLPYNLDAWDGYASARETLYKLLKRDNLATVVLTGDAHFAWSNKLEDCDGDIIGIELGTTSVTSPGIEADYNIEDPQSLQQLEKSTKLFDANAIYSNYTDRGYMIIEVTENEVRNHWRYVNRIDTTKYRILQSRNRMMRIAKHNDKYLYRLS